MLRGLIGNDSFPHVTFPFLRNILRENFFVVPARGRIKLNSAGLNSCHMKRGPRENKGTEREAPSPDLEICQIPLKLLLAISHERKSVFRDVRIKANLDLMF